MMKPPPTHQRYEIRHNDYGAHWVIDLANGYYAQAFEDGSWVNVSGVGPEGLRRCEAWIQAEIDAAEVPVLL